MTVADVTVTGSVADGQAQQLLASSRSGLQASQSEIDVKFAAMIARSSVSVEIENTNKEEPVRATAEARPLQRLRLMETTPELWDEEGLATPDRDVIDRTRQILRLLVSSVDESRLRVYPSDREGISIEMDAGESARIVDVEPGHMAGFDLLDPPTDSRRYEISSTGAAATFLAHSDAAI